MRAAEEQRIDHHAALFWALLAGVVALCGQAIWAPLLSPDRLAPDPDLLRFLIDRELIVSTARQYGEFPLRSPFLGGGVPSFSHPHDAAAHPWILLSFLLGPLAGLKAEFLLGWALSALGFGLLGARGLRLHPAAVVFLVVTGATLTWGPHRLFGGDVPELQYFTAPLLLYLVIEARQRRWAAVAATLLLAMVALVAAYRVVLIAGLPILWIATEAAVRRGQTLRRDLVVVLGVSLGALLLASPRLLPVVDELLGSARARGSFVQPFQTPGELWLALTRPPTAPGLLKTWNHWPGALAPLLAPLALLRPRRAASAVLVAVAAASLILGPHGPLNPWPLVSRMPGLSAMTAAPKQASYFLLLAVLVAAALSVDHAAMWLQGRRQMRWVGVAAALVLAVATRGAIGHSHELVERALPVTRCEASCTGVGLALRDGQVVDPPPVRQRFQTIDYAGLRQPDPVHVMDYGPFEYPVMLYLLRAGYGQTQWWDTFFGDAPVVPASTWDAQLRKVRSNPDYRGEVWTDGGRDCVQLLTFSALEITLHNRCDEPVVAVVNQRWHADWGAPAADHGGLLSAPLAPRQTLSLRYTYRHRVLAVLGWLAGLAVLAGLALVGPARGRRAALALVLLAAAYPAVLAAGYGALQGDARACLPRPGVVPLPQTENLLLGACEGEVEPPDDAAQEERSCW